MAAGHLVAHLELALLGDVDLGHLDHARLRQLVAVREVVLLALDGGVGLLPLDRIVVDRGLDQRIGVLVARPAAGTQVEVAHRHAGLLVRRLAGDLLQQLLRELRAGRIELQSEVVGDAARGLALKQRPQLGHQALREFGDLSRELLVELLQCGALGALALLGLLARTAVKLGVDHHAVQRGLRLHRGVLHVAGLVAEDGAQQLLLGRRIALALRGDLADQDVARMHVGADADDAVGVEILGRLLAHVRNIRRELLDAALRVAHLHDVLIDVHRREDVLALDALRNHDGILEVVTLPGHERHLQVAAQGQLAVLRRVALGQDLSARHLLARQHDGLERDRRILVRTAVARQHVGRDLGCERGEDLILRTFVADLDLRGVGEDHLAVALGDDLDAAVRNHVLLDARTHDRRLARHEGHGLAHHVRTHQRTVGIVVLQERNEAGGDRSDLVRRHVHQVHLLVRHHGEVGTLARLDAVGLEEVTLLVDGHVRLRHDLALLLFGRVIFDVRVVHVDHAVLHRAVGGLDESHGRNLRIDAQRRNQTDVRAFRRLDRAQTAVVRVVHVAHLEAGAVARQTAGTEGRQAALVRDLGQGVDLVHELRELRGAEERVDHARQRLGVDQVHRREHLVVAHVHALADRAGHAHEAYRELVRKLLAHRADTTVREVVDVVHLGFRVDELDQVLDDGDDVLARKRADRRIGIHAELLVDAETAHVAQVVALVREEELLDHVARRSLIGRLRSAQLPVDVHHGLLLGVARVFLQRIVYDGKVDARGILLVQQNRLGTALDDLIYVLLLEYGLAVHDHVVALDGHHLARILVHEVLDPRREHARRQLAAYGLLERRLRHLHLVRKVEDFENLLVGLVADGAQQGRDRKLFLTVDVGVHHVVDVRGELDPRTLERDDAGRIELRAVCMHALTEEYAGRTVQLRDDHALGTVDDERTALGHVGNRTEINVLHRNAEIFVFVVRAVEFELRFQRHAVREAAFEALFDRIAGRVDIVVDKLQNEVVPGIGNGEILLKHLVQPLVLTILGRRVHLEKVTE